ncbi:MAG TPA: helix-turn-helix domain-containing protein [candidate division Zixibacteria bacterium]|nr:helix-turn-helix domain-containing protein [candidate division Zixibacteria bacterium]
MPPPEEKEDVIISQLKGTTLRVFWFASSLKDVGVREVQRSLELSSPSVSSYHLEKLCNLGLATKDRRGRYKIIKKVNVGELRLYFKVKNWLVPRWIFYAAFVTILFLGYMIFFFDGITTASIFVIIISGIVMIIFWIETALGFKNRPF